MMKQKNKLQQKGSCSSYQLKDILKFLIPSLIGVVLFMMPISHQGQITIPIALLSEWVRESLAEVLPTIILGLVMTTAIGSIVTKLLKPKFIVQNEFLNNLFTVTPVWFVIRLLAAIFVVMTLYEVGFEAIFH